MDKELQRLLEEARSRGASTQQLDDILARYNSKKKEQPEEPFQFGVSDTESLSPSQEVKEPAEEVAVEEEPQGFGFYFENNPVNKLIKKVPVVSEIYTGIESLIGSTFKNAEMMLKENVPQYLITNPVYRVAEQALMANTTVDEKLAGFFGAAGDIFMEDSKKGTEGILKTYGLSEDQIGKGVVGNIIDGDIGAGATVLASSVLQQIPQLAAMAAAGPVAGASLLGASASGSKYAEIQDDETLSSGEKALYSIAIGVAEGAAEYMFKTDVSQLRRVFGNKQTLDEFRDILTKELKKETLLKSTLEEGGEEFIVGVTDLLIESALKGDVDNWDREAVLELADQFLIGSTVGGSIHGLTRGVNSMGSTKNERDIADAKNDISTLVKKKENASPEEAKIIDELIEERISDLISKQGEDIEFYKKFSEQDRQELIGINKEIRAAAKKYNTAEGETLKAKYKQEVDDLRARKQEIENKYSEEKVRYIKDGKEFSRGEFVEMVNKATPEEIATGQWGVENDAEVEQLLLNKLPQDDSKKEERVPSTEQKEEAPKQAEPIQEGGVEAPPTGGVVQEAKQLTLSDGTAVQEGIQVVAKNPVDGSDIQGTIILEGDPDNPRVSVETETDIVELGTSEDINPADIKPFTAAVAETETLTANEDGSFTYNKEGNPTVAKGSQLTLDGSKGLSAVSVFSGGQFVPLTEDADREQGLRVQMLDQDGNAVQLYGQDALDATYNIMLAMDATQAAQLNKLLDNEETINAIAEAEESARKDSEAAQEAAGTAVEEAGERNSPEYVRSKVSQLQEEDVDNLKEELSGTFGLLTAENPDAVQLSEEENAARNEEAEAWLRERGYSPRKIAGRFEGLAENSFFVPNLKLSDALAFAKKFGQKSVAHSEGMIYRDGTMNPRVKGSDSFDFADFKSESDFVSTINTAEGPKTFSVGYDFDSKVDSGEALLSESDVSSEKFGSNFNTLKDNFQKLLSKLGGENIPVYVVSDEVYRSVTGKKGRATFTPINGKNVIVLNADKATLGSVYHEMMHAYVATMKLSPRQIVDFVNTIRAELAKGNASERALAKRLTRFQTEYIKQEVYGKGLKLDDPIIAEEFLGEFVAQLKDGIDVNNMSLSTIEKIRLAIAKFINKVFNASIDTSPIENRQEAFDFINGFLDALEGRVDVEPSINKTANPNQAQRSRLQIEAPAGSKLFNTPLEDATTLARQYMDSKGLEYKEGSSFNKIDEERAKRISDAYIAMKDEPTNPAVAAAYNAMAEETLEQYELISKAGYTVEMSDKEYDNSAQMIADLRDNKRMRIFSTEAGFGDDPITAKQRSENPLLQTTKYKDVNGEPLLVNDVFRFVHDFFGHAKRGNSFGPKGEENAWDVHSRMYTPLARRAMTSETRGQNSYVNFSGVNAEAFKLRDKARELRKEGKFAEAKELTNQVYGMMKFADQKVGLLPDEFVENPYDNAPSLLEEEEQGEAGEVGTINIPRQQIEVIDAPKLSEDNRSFVQKFVTDIKMAALQGRRFVTNMYDYTNAGVTNLGNGYSIELFGGRNYVPMMMERNGAELGDVSNLAAFNSKEQAEGFIRNATKGKADLFGPHSGGLEGSWQFQHHIFESLVNLVLDNKILGKSELIELFNTGLNTKGTAGGIKAFAKFNERNKSKLRNLSSFKKNPLELVELLNAENNYSPNLRKILNQKIASNKKFQKAIGVKNLNEFHNRISDPLNIGVSGGEIMTFVEFDPSTFKIVKTKPGDANHHPSFGWVVMAKIKAIHHPDKYYKSYDITDSYTKHNVDGTVVEKKSEVTEKEFIESNVKSSAGAIAKIAEVDIPREQIDFTGSETLNEFSFNTTAYKDGKYRKVTSTEKSDKPIAIKFPDGLVAVVRSRKDELAEAKQFLKDVRKGVYPYADVNLAENKVDILEGISEGTDFHVDLFDKNGNIIGGIKLANNHFDYYSPKIAKMLGKDYKDGLIYTSDDRMGGKAVGIERDFRGKGYGARLYHSALRLLRAQYPGARLISNEDTNVSKSAKNFWRGHYNKGLARVIANTSTPQEIERIGGPVVLKQLKDFGMEYTGDIYELLDPTEAVKPERKYDVPSRPQERQQIDWQLSEFGRDKVNSTIITRGQFLQQAAQDLLEGKITNEEYKETVKIVSEIDPIAKFFLPASNDDMKNALGKAKSKKLNVQLEDGEYVGLRLDIPAYVNSNIWVVTAHKGTGAPLTYGSVAWATDVKFGTNPKVAAFIAAGKNYDLVGRYRIDEVEVDGKIVYKFFDTKTGKYYAEKGVDLTKNSYNEAGRYRADRLEKQDKSTIGKMLGKWKNFEGKTKEEKDASAVKKVEEIVKIENSYPGSARKGSPWRQIGMNPFRHSYFYDRRNGKPVVGAAEVVQVGGLVYAKDVEYADWSDDQFTVNGYYDADGQPVRFQLDADESAKVEKEAFAALEKGEIPAPLYKKTWYQKVYSALFRTELEKEILKLKEKKEAQISRSEEQSRFIANRIKKYAKTPKALELANEYLVSENKKDAKEAILKLPNGAKLLSELRTARAFIDNISNELVNDPAFDGLDDELRLSIQDNLTTYLRTQYRFFTDKSFDINKRRDAAVQAQFNQLLAQEIGLLSAMGMSPLDIQTDINKRRSEIAAEAAQMIDGYISDLQDIKYQPSQGGAGIKMPNAPFRRKKDLPDYIQQLLGKEKDPVRKFAQTSQALSNILYKGRMLDGIIDIVGTESEYILDEEPRSPKDKQYTKVNDPYSKLNGKWVHNEIMDMVNQKPLYASDKAWANVYFNTLKLARKSKVIWNVTTWRKNLTGGWYFIMANGIANPRFVKDFTQRTKLMFKVRGEKFTPDAETEQLLDLMAEYGVTGKSIDANLIGLSQAAYQFGLDGDENAYYARAKQVFNNVSNKDKWLQEKYAAVDDYTKLIIFRSEIDTYAKKLYGKEYSELNESQKDNVHEQAAERVKQSTPTFSRLPKWFDKVAVIPIVGDFVSFRLESLRSYGMNVANGVSDIKKSQETGLSDTQKKAYLQAGLRRLAGSGTVFALKLAITKLLTELFLGDEEEDLEDDVKKLRPEWMDGQSIIPRSIDRDGNVRVYNYSSEDPYGDVSDIFGGPESWGAMVTDFIRPNIAADLIFNLSKGEDIYGRKIADYSDSKVNQTLDVLGYTAKQIVVPPTISSSFRDAWLKSDLPKKERAINLASTIAERSIIRDYKYNVVDSFVNDLRKISGTRKSYLDYDNPARRLKQLDEIRSQWESIVAIGLAKKNYDMIDKAERYARRHLESLDEDYVFEGIIIKK